MNLLHVDSSILGDHSVSRQITAAAVEALSGPGVKVTYRDLAASPPPQVSADLLAAKATPAADRTPAQAALVADAQAILDEFMAADAVVIGVPMYNFGIPSQLKSWIDHLAVAGVTFRYGETGAEGLAGGKRLILASARGGFYGAETPLASWQHQESYLRTFFTFIGIPEVEVIHAEGGNISPDLKAKALEGALAHAAGLNLARAA